MLKISELATKLGPVLVIANHEKLYFLQFTDAARLEQQVASLQRKVKSAIVPGITEPMRSLSSELSAYFHGLLTAFKTPVHLLGSPFQQRVWDALMRTPYGQTQTYRRQSEAIERPTAYRAVANAHAANPISILVPCHRVIHTNGKLGGYGGGFSRKKWLIAHEQRNA